MINDTISQNSNQGSPELISGLTQKEVISLRNQYGFNDIPEEKKNPILKFLSYFWGPIPWMIEVAAILSAVISHWDDFTIIILLLLINAVVGFFQERKADNAIELLKKQLAPNAHTLRDGTWQDIPARELVPGDIIHIRLGDIVPADAQLSSGSYLLLDESALTGESLPVEKKANDTIYSGSIVRQGEMDARVTSIGENTSFGKTARLIQAKPPQSHFKVAVEHIGNYLIILAIILVGIVLVSEIFRAQPFFETLQFCLILVVAAIPAALPAVMTVTLSVGATALARKGAIVSRLTAIEEMAGMDILCSDKTGTITKNSISIGDIKTFSGISEEDIIVVAAMASTRANNDPIDMAIFSRFDTISSGNLYNFEVLDFIPFNPDSKISRASIRDHAGNVFDVVKGAPQAISSLVGNQTDLSSTLDEWISALAGKGFRALGVAKTDSSGTWQNLGLIGLFDPPREDSVDTIHKAGDLGVVVKMVTGDHIAIAQEISRQVGLGQNILERSELLSGDGDKARSQLEATDGFAQVRPEDKFQIVKTLQGASHIIGMTGDGVNDAPALREADAGIAVHGATDAAKSAADIVFTKPGLSVIIDAIERSREIFQRMESYAIYRIAETVRILIFLALCIVLLNFYPVTALMIVVLAILNDLPIMMIAFDNASVAPKPVKWKMNCVLTLASLLGILGVIESFILLWLAKEYFHLDAGVVQTLIFLKLAVAGHMTIYLARTGQEHFWKRPYPSLALIGTAEITQICATLIAIYGVFMTPIGWTIALIVWGYALTFILIIDQIKVLLFRKIHPYS
jgi:H+-transporting ATPase